MSDLGKIDRELFDSSVYPNLGADCDDILLGSQQVVDFGVVDVGERAVTLPDEDIPAADIGEVVDGDGVEHPGVDPFWGAFEEYMSELQATTEDEEA